MEGDGPCVTRKVVNDIHTVQVPCSGHYSHRPTQIHIDPIQSPARFSPLPNLRNWRACVKISPRRSQKRLRFGDDVGKREFIKFAKKYHQQLEEECASVGRVTVRAMSPPWLADIGVLLQEAEEATRD